MASLQVISKEPHIMKSNFCSIVCFVLRTIKRVNIADKSLFQQNRLISSRRKHHWSHRYSSKIRWSYSSKNTSAKNYFCDDANPWICSAVEIDNKIISKNNKTLLASIESRLWASMRAPSVSDSNLKYLSMKIYIEWLVLLHGRRIWYQNES